jgi:hypothetical protein
MGMLLIGLAVKEKETVKRNSEKTKTKFFK